MRSPRVVASSPSIQFRINYYKMCRVQTVLSLLLLYLGMVHSWDIAVTTNDKLDFFSNGRKIRSEGVQFRDLTALTYDAVNHMLLFVDKQSDNASIFSYKISSDKYQALIKRKAYENIQGLVFDPVKRLLFWTDSNERSIYWISLKPETKNIVNGNLLIKMDDEVPRAIAVDSCRGYIYWTNTNTEKPTIERARFNGSEREVVINTDIDMPVTLAIDQRTKKMYWMDDRKGIHFSIESADLNGKNRTTLFAGIYHQPNALTVSKDFIYWVDWGYKTVWQLPKNPVPYQEPTEIGKFNSKTSFGIAANYKIEEQTEGSSDCETLTSLLPKTGNTDPSSLPTEEGWSRVYGIKNNGTLPCSDTPCYTGESCDVPVCLNYCVQGDCRCNVEGLLKCRCNAGYSGQRCEVNMCINYCLNNGDCSLNEDGKPVCQCVGNYEGSRCEAVKDDTFTTLNPFLN